MNIIKLKKEANKGNVNAQEKLAYYYDKGISVRKSYAKAFYWYKKASVNGNPIVEYNIGLCYLRGQGTQQNDPKAFSWTQKSARKEYSDGMLALAWHYYNGIGTKADINNAKKWYNKCIGTDCASSAYFNLGQIAYEIEEDYQKAFEYFNQAIQYDHSNSSYYLGRMYFEGKGVSNDMRKAKEYLTKAFKAGIYNAKRLLKSKKFARSTEARRNL
jgi:TPR repeat protein